jgi:hypothetical protein
MAVSNFFENSRRYSQLKVHHRCLSLTPEANLSPVSLTPVAKLPPVSTTPPVLMAKFATGGNCRWFTLIRVVHLDLKKIGSDPNFIFRGLGGVDF